MSEPILFSSNINLDYTDESDQNMEINVAIFDGSIQIDMTARRFARDDDGGLRLLDTEEWSTQMMPPEIGIRLRDFLNYAYPREAT